MTYAGYTKADFFGYHTPYLMAHDKWRGPVWFPYVDDTIMQDEDAPTHVTETMKILLGASLTWTNSPLHDSVLYFSNDDFPIEVTIASNVEGTLMGIHAFPSEHDASPSYFSYYRFSLLWDDDVLTTAAEGTFEGSGPSVEFAVDLAALRPSSSAGLTSIQVYDKAHEDDDYTLKATAPFTFSDSGPTIHQVTMPHTVTFDWSAPFEDQ